nr:hypothetical protein [uncultured Methanoregula sp.]
MAEPADEIIGILAPVIGTGLAISAVNMQCRKMGIMPENLHGDTLIDFADRFRMPIQYFAGENVAHEIVHRIKALESPAPNIPHTAEKILS